MGIEKRLRISFDVTREDVFPERSKSYIIKDFESVLQKNIIKFIKERKSTIESMFNDSFKQLLREEMTSRNQIASGNILSHTHIKIDDIQDFLGETASISFNAKSPKNAFDYYGWHGRKFTKFDAILNWVKARGFDRIYNKRYKSYNSKNKEEIQRRIAFAIRFSKKDGLRSNIFKKISGEDETIIERRYTTYATSTSGKESKVDASVRNVVFRNVMVRSSTFILDFLTKNVDKYGYFNLSKSGARGVRRHSQQYISKRR